MTSTELALPVDGDSQHWSDQERALVKAAGLVRTEGRGPNASEYLADRPTVEAFLAHCRRTGLDPIARQIYAIYRAGKWGIQISIDGARLVAERTGAYEGQTPVEWTADGITWTQVWLADEHPKAARVGVYRRGFREPLFAVATWDSYAVMKDEWVDNKKTGNKVVSDMWAKFGPLMLGKCAEMLALRKAFPQDLSGLYSTEEMAQASGEPQVVRASERAVAAPVAPSEPSRDWAAEAYACNDLEALTALANEAQAAGELGLAIGLAGDKDDGSAETVMDVLQARRRDLLAGEKPEPLVKEPAKPKARQWVAEARKKADAGDIEGVRVLYREAEGQVSPEVLGQIEAIEAALSAPSDEELAKAPGWAPSEPTTAEWPVAEIPAEGAADAGGVDEQPI